MSTPETRISNGTVTLRTSQCTPNPHTTEFVKESCKDVIVSINHAKTCDKYIVFFLDLASPLAMKFAQARRHKSSRWEGSMVLNGYVPTGDKGTSQKACDALSVGSPTDELCVAGMWDTSDKQKEHNPGHFMKMQLRDSSLSVEKWVHAAAGVKGKVRLHTVVNAVKQVKDTLGTARGVIVWTPNEFGVSFSQAEAAASQCGLHVLNATSAPQTSSNYPGYYAALPSTKQAVVNSAIKTICAARCIPFSEDMKLPECEEDSVFQAGCLVDIVLLLDALQQYTMVCGAKKIRMDSCLTLCDKEGLKRQQLHELCKVVRGLSPLAKGIVHASLQLS